MKELTIRNLLTNDLPLLQDIHASNCDFPFPDLLNQLYCCNKVVEDSKGKIIGVGFVRLTSESILILDKQQPKSLRVRAIKLLFDRMKKDMRFLGMDETHAFVEDSEVNLRSMLKKLFGFIECKARSVYLQF
jgi:hypothetical protein